ncbi:MAG TPA: pantoate--beta-alanine ligase [Solirubrobacterales bacterium]
MRVIETVAEMHEARSGLAGSVGLVPTMGFLHEGHLSLVRASRAENARTVVSIFVNPTQFGPSEDFATYPRDVERDLSLLRAEGVDLVYAPTVAEMYPAGYSTYVEVGGVTERLEGAARPGHFRGVATVVAKLFAAVQPTRAYFGQKDAQQCAVIRKMVADLSFALEVRVMPTVREADGLALSSRNVYLRPDERVAALSLSRGLFAARDAWASGERDAEKLRGTVRAAIAAEPLVRLEYASVADAATLEEAATVDRPALISLAARVGRTRLIDNVVLG